MQSEITRHYYTKDIIKEVGFPAAPLFEHIMYWVLHNEANQINFHDGKFWMYNSQKSIQEQFDYLTIRQIEHSIKILADRGFVVVAHYGKDNTNWYSIGENGMPFYNRLVKEQAEKTGENDKNITKTENLLRDTTQMWGNTSMCDDTTHPCGDTTHRCVVSDTSYKDINKDQESEKEKKNFSKKKADQQPSFFDSPDEISEPVEKEEQIQKPVEQPKNLKPISIPPMPLPWDEEYQRKSEEDPNFEENWTKQWGKYCPIGKADPKTNKTVLLDEETGATYEENMNPLNEIAISLSRKNQGEQQQGQFVSTDPNTPITFEEFWAVYDLKTDKIKCRKLFDKLSKYDRIAIHQNLQAYIDSTPDKQYRKKPHRWLENRCWEDEIVLHDRFGRQTRDYTGL